LRELEKELKAGAGPAKGKTPRAGQIIIVGKEKTAPEVILRQVALYPGSELTGSDFHDAACVLEKVGLFRKYPTLSVLNPDSPDEFKDVLIEVVEK
jgi:outer membrane protein assembly factor BamA